MRVELFVAKEDFTWSTAIAEVPDTVGQGHDKGGPLWEHEVSTWAHKTLAAQGKAFPLIAVWDAYPEDKPGVELDDDEEEEIASIPQDID